MAWAKTRKSKFISQQLILSNVCCRLEPTVSPMAMQRWNLETRKSALFELLFETHTYH
jgi:hypothetical protein